MRFHFLVLLFFAAPALAVGQLFPYDRTAPEGIDVGDEDALILMSIDEHLQHFGNEELTVEVYADRLETIELSGLWAYRSSCLETLFLEKMKVAGEFKYLVSSSAKYWFVFYSGRQFVEVEINVTPDGHVGSRCQRFGDWPTKKI